MSEKVRTKSSRVKTLVLGIGNPILGDDGVGFHIAHELAKLIKKKSIDVKDASTSGLNLLDMIIGYDKVVIIDAIKIEGGEPGEIYRLRPEDFFRNEYLATSIHAVNLPIAIGIGNKLMPEEMPDEIVVFAIEVESIEKFTEEMTEKVKEAIPKVVNLLLEEISESNKGNVLRQGKPAFRGKCIIGGSRWSFKM